MRLKDGEGAPGRLPLTGAKLFEKIFCKDWAEQQLTNTQIENIVTVKEH